MDRESSELPRASDSISNSLDDIPNAGGGVVSERVQYFANAIYGQLEKLVKKYDEDAVKDLMPHVISLLENLDQLSNEKRQLEVDIELIREDNSQLLVQYEREKTMRRSIEQKCLEIEDSAEEEQQGLTDKIASMESIVRMLELKSKNSADHVARLEEKESEMKKDYTKLYQKYQELMRSHIDIMERRSFVANEPQEAVAGAQPSVFAPNMMPRSSEDMDSRVPRMSEDAHHDKAEPKSDYQVVDNGDGSAIIKDSVPDATRSSRFEEELSFQEEDLINVSSGRQRIRKGNDGDNEQESSDEDGEGEAEGEAEDNLGSTPLGLSLGASDFAIPGRQSTFSVGREFDKLLRENAELLETKNALNVVKDDLIFQVDGLNNELRIFRERIASLEGIREHLQQRVAQLEEDGKRVKDELEETKNRLSASAANNGNGEDEASVQDAASTGATADGAVTQRRRFTRMEMARVLMERNVYKERLIELQETVRWVESLRASREHPDATPPEQRKKSSSSFWNFFGGLFAAPSPTRKTAPAALPPPPPMPAGLLDVNLGTSLTSGRLQGPLDITGGDSRQQRSRSVISSQSTGSQGRVEAYGWSIPASTCFTTTSHHTGMARSRAATRLAGATTPVAVTTKPDVPVPIPVCCQPLPGSLNGMKIWSAAVAFSSIGWHPDGSRLFERSVFYSSPRNSFSRNSNSGETTPTIGQDGQMTVSADVAELEEEVSLEQHRVRASRGQLAELSSVAWLTCSSNNVNTHVFLVDLRQPSVLLAGFTLDAPYVSQVCAVPGAKPTDIAWQPSATVGEGHHNSMTSGRSGSKCDDTADDDCVELSRDGDRSRNDANTSGWLLSVTENVKVKVSTLNRFSVDSQAAPRPSAESSPKPQPPPSSPPSAAAVGAEATGAASIDNTRSLLMPSMWFGAQDGSMFIYSASSAVQPAIDDSPQQLPAILGRVQLPSAPTAIGHVAGRVFVALSTSELAMFHRNPETKEWCVDECSIIQFKRDLSATQSTTAADNSNADDPLNSSRKTSNSPAGSVLASQTVPAARCLVAVANRYLWVGLGREVLVIEPASLRIESSFVCHPRQDAQLRHACSVGDGVWLAVRIDSVLRLFHAFTHQHLQDLDLQPSIHSFIFGDATPAPGTNTAALSPMRVSAMVAGGGRLWIGTHTGLIVSVPFASAEQQIMVRAGPTGSSSNNAGATSNAGKGGPTTTPTHQGPGAIVQVFASPRSHTLTPGTNLVPYCWVGGAQISCHGHTDSVKAIVCSPIAASNNSQADANDGNVPKQSSGIPSLAIMSVGEGYRDCRSAVVAQQATAVASGGGVVVGGPSDGGQSSSGGISPIPNVGLSAILASTPPQARQSLPGGGLSTTPSPPGEERIHMIVWQLALSSGH